jgi:hypothetical protein
VPVTQTCDREVAERNVAQRVLCASVLAYPALLNPLVERRTAARCQLLHRERAELLTALYVALKRFGIALERELTGTLVAVFAPSCDPSVAASVAFNAHDSGPRITRTLTSTSRPLQA